MRPIFFFVFIKTACPALPCPTLPCPQGVASVFFLGYNIIFYLFLGINQSLGTLGREVIAIAKGIGIGWDFAYFLDVVSCGIDWDFAYFIGAVYCDMVFYMRGIKSYDSFATSCYKIYRIKLKNKD
jgi:hypothetical protein